VPHLGPRLVIAGTSSGVGKTTVATGLLAALKARGMNPAGAKVGPDFIDPGYHSLACGRPPRNLDPWLCGPDAIAPLAARAGAGADVLIIEGVMGMFDGAVDSAPSSTADVARLLDAPIVLVIDASAMSSSVAALVHGFTRFDPSVRVAGVILNQVGSDGHELLLREALAPLATPVLGALRRDDAMRWRDRHLGLVPVAEKHPDVAASLDRLAAAVANQVDLDAVLALAASAEPGTTNEVPLPDHGDPVTIGVAGGPAFTFTYADTLDALEAAGATLAVFDPLRDDHLPAELDGLIIGGGFPEEYASTLAGNRPLLDELASAHRDGTPIWAECGGLLLLCDELDGHPMAGVLPARAEMTSRLTLGYRTAEVGTETPVGPPGTVLRGHEFHYSAVDPGGDALTLESRFGSRPEGWAGPDLLATYLHFHPGGDPEPIQRFAARCALRRALRSA
jgi:cobyrinic acid a,c-diamide synthase